MTMSEFNWQLAIVVLTVSWAAWYIARRAYGTFARTAGTNNCTTCHSCDKQPPLVELKLQERP